MGSTRIAILVVAAFCAIGLTFLVGKMLSAKKAPPAAVATAPVQEKPMARVLVAKRDLAVGETITVEMLGWQPWPVEAVNPAFITDGAARPVPTGAAAAAAAALEAVAPESPAMTAMQGSIVREPILAQEPIVQRKLVRGGQGGFMAVVLQPGMRAFSVPMTVETGAGGFILPNDHVDILLNQKVDAQNKDAASAVGVAKVLMRNVRVLAVDQATTPAEGAHTIVGSTATLEVPSEDIEMLAAAKTQGEIVLTLRSYNDAAGPPVRAASGRSELVRVFRNGEPTDVRVIQ